MDANCSGLLIFCLFVQTGEAKLDPITDIFRTMHVTAFGLHRLEATAPWGVKQEKQTEEKVTPSDKKMPPTDLFEEFSGDPDATNYANFGSQATGHRANQELAFSRSSPEG